MLIYKQKERLSIIINVIPPLYRLGSFLLTWVVIVNVVEFDRFRKRGKEGKSEGGIKVTFLSCVFVLNCKPFGFKR